MRVTVRDARPSLPQLQGDRPEIYIFERSTVTHENENRKEAGPAAGGPGKSIPEDGAGGGSAGGTDPPAAEPGQRDALLRHMKDRGPAKGPPSGGSDTADRTAAISSAYAGPLLS